MEKTQKLSKSEKILAKKEKNSSAPSSWSKFLSALQELGKALQFPIAMLPFAAILNRFGALGIQYTSDASGITNQVGYWISFIIQKPGGVVFDNLPLFFAIGTAFGLAKDHRGEVALVGAVFYLILAAMTAEHSLPEMIYKNVLTFETDGGQKLSKLFYVEIYGDNGKDIISGAYVLNVGVLGGITAGCLSSFLYNRLKDTKLPVALSFFGGRRFVPMVAIVTAIPTALAFAVVWPWIQFGLMAFGKQIADPTNPAVAIPGTAVYGVLNRLLLPFGLHQILNTFFWFQLPIRGDVIGTISGDIIEKDVIVNGDINAFTAGIEGSGLFQSGFFPIMMGGVPAAAIAMIFTAKKENRKEVAGFLGGVAAVSFLSGITEPVEFSFVFISPLLLGLHGVMTGIFVAITTAMRIQIGFGFSAGFIDYAISFAQSWGFSQSNTGAWRVVSNPLWILVLVVAAAAAYFSVFYFTIKGLNLQTPGREEAVSQGVGMPKVKENGKKSTKDDKYEYMAKEIVDAIGVDNFVSIDNCATRLRLILKDNRTIDDAKIKASGAFGIKKLGTEGLQVVIGPDVEHVTEKVKKIVNQVHV